MKKTFTLLILLCSTAVWAQIPNGGFENWTAATGYDTPDGWDNLNPTTSASSIYTCVKGTPGAPGASFIKLTSKTVLTAVSPGIAVCGKMDVTTQKAKSGFPWSTRPQSIVGKWQYMPASGDAGALVVVLTKWNTALSKRDTVATKIQVLSGMAMSWTNFSYNLDYLKGFNPDSAIIVLSASGLTPKDGSYLWVDSLSFVGSVPISVEQTVKHTYNIQTYPNPVKNSLSVDFGKTVKDNLNLQMIDGMGRVVKDINYNSGQQVYNINVAELPKGLYYLKAKSGDDIQTKTITVE